MFRVGKFQSFRDASREARAIAEKHGDGVHVRRAASGWDLYLTGSAEASWLGLEPSVRVFSEEWFDQELERERSLDEDFRQQLEETKDGDYLGPVLSDEDEYVVDRLKLNGWPIDE